MGSAVFFGFVLLLATSIAAPVSAHSIGAAQQPVKWLAAGDSYSSGQGIPDASGHCGRSTKPYGVLAADALRRSDSRFADLNFASTACSGDVANGFTFQRREADIDYASTAKTNPVVHIGVAC